MVYHCEHCKNYVPAENVECFIVGSKGRIRAIPQFIRCVTCDWEMQYLPKANIECTPTRETTV